MQALFPCGDHMIAMIDDRPDVWQYSDALIQVSNVVLKPILNFPNIAKLYDRLLFSLALSLIVHKTATVLGETIPIFQRNR